MSKSILVTGATGKQGGAVVDALLALPNASDYTILATTRDKASEGAKRLASKSSSIKIVQGDLDHPGTLLADASKAAGGSVWGVYSVQAAIGKGASPESELRQGKALVDEAVKHGVKVFVYSSVDRGGDEKSWNSPTAVPHFKSKHEIEHYLKTKAGEQMGWTILRPAAFMENIEPNFQTKVFQAAMRDTLKGKKVQWVATSDIGFFGALAFARPDEWNHKSLSLAGDSLSYEDMRALVKKQTGKPLDATFGVLGSLLKRMVPDMGLMVDWFASDGFGADIPKLRSLNPKLLNFETWLREKSHFPKHR